MPGQLLLEHVGNKLPHKPTWEKLVKAWGDVLNRYLQREKGYDLPHWNTEPSLNGFLAAAVWIANGVALEEYSTERLDEDQKTTTGKGLLDLYFHLEDLDCVVEAKQDWPTDSSEECRERINKFLDAADCQLDALRDDEDQANVGMAICWVCPKLGPNTQNEEAVLRQIAKSFEESADVIAIYHVPREERESLKDEDNADNDGRRYPGVIWVGRQRWS